MEKLVVLALMATFVAIRARHRPGYRAQRRRGPAATRERALVLGVTLGTFAPLMLYAAGALDPWSRWAGPAPLAIGLGLGLGGLVLLWRTHAALGLNFSPLVDLREDHALVQHGPYRFVRHPMYTSGFLLFLGIGLISGNPALAVPPLVALSVLVAARLPSEEAMLAERFGESWRRYSRSTGRLLPGRGLAS
jgi:protein-S-isoprenylcysteine O-methyltransferase Ste14